MKRKMLIFVYLIAVMLLSAGSAFAGHLEDIAARGTIRIGTTGDYIPMSYLNPRTGAYEGIDAELSQLIAASLGGENRVCTHQLANAYRRYAGRKI